MSHVPQGAGPAVLLAGSFLWDQAMWVPQRINGLVMMDTCLGVEPEPPRQYYLSLLQQIEEAGAIALRSPA
ncbi:hypothetical protein PMI29_00615 [Pseudomonas sp. GM49]|nr:hypothetical protein PMI29_00615 [Pseudomonas sp. GM49]